jgi:hypothetical protein
MFIIEIHVSYIQLAAYVTYRVTLRGFMRHAYVSTSRSVTHSEIAPDQARLNPTVLYSWTFKKEGISWWYEYSINPINP